VSEAEDYDTIAGWLLDLIDTVPRIGDVFEVENYSFMIQSMRRNRISKMRVVRREELPQ
jgi:putative hemolysin